MTNNNLLDKLIIDNDESTEKYKFITDSINNLDSYYQNNINLILFINVL